MKSIYFANFSILTVPILMIQGDIINVLQTKELVLKNNIQLVWVLIWGVTSLIWAIINIEKLKSIKIKNDLMKEEARKLKLENDNKNS